MKRENEAIQNPEHMDKRLLVVDDDSSVREIVSRILAGEGYFVLAASSGTEALEIAATPHCSRRGENECVPILEFTPFQA